MTTPPPKSTGPLISVIIPCFNHGKFLPDAIKSVVSQSYQEFEIIVVDDGSVDDTELVCVNHPGVKYVFQANSGLSAARNTGIRHARGRYLVFLDADDWLLNDALKTNLDFIRTNSDVAFVSGGYELYYEPEDKTWIIQSELQTNHYCKLLEGNYIGMHGAVMYQRRIFDHFLFATSLWYCEDYDLYLKIARIFPILHHTSLIAVYRKHDNNMSANYAEMMKYALRALSSQYAFLQTSQEKTSFEIGLRYWKSYYSEKIYSRLVAELYDEETHADKWDLRTLKKNNRELYQKYKETRRYFPGRIQKKGHRIKKSAVNIISKLKKKIRSITSAGARKVDLGDLNRTTPFSERFGYDRGGPVDRYYIENFLRENAAAIRGRVLEIGDNAYTLEFGRESVLQGDILHIDENNPKATFVGDLSNAPHLPDESFDCIILTQTLHLIYNYQDAINTCYRVLKPGGTLLVTVPGISHIAQDEWGKFWLWSFTASSMEKIMKGCFSDISVKTHGNVLVATAFLYGMGLPELTRDQLDTMDPHYQVIITVKAIK